MGRAASICGIGIDGSVNRGIKRTGLRVVCAVAFVAVLVAGVGFELSHDRDQGGDRLPTISVRVVHAVSDVDHEEAIIDAISVGTTPPRRWRSGVFAGYGTAGDQQFARWRGSPIQTATDFIGAGSWQAIEDPAWTIAQWAADPAVQPDLSVAMWPATGGSLAQAASGAYDGYFHALAENLVAGGLAGASIRLGWEFNGTWYRWSVRTPAQAAQYVRAWRGIVTSMRVVSGQRFRFDWAPTLSSGGLDPALAFPGSDYVSDVGLDVYDFSAGPGLTPPQRWSGLVNARYGLAWQARFAAQHGEPLAFPEWGLVEQRAHPATGGGDDPFFVESMFTWFATHNVAFEDYFNSDDPGEDLYYGLTTGNGLAPRAATAYRSLYGG